MKPYLRISAMASCLAIVLVGFSPMSRDAGVTQGPDARASLDAEGLVKAATVTVGDAVALFGSTSLGVAPLEYTWYLRNDGVSHGADTTVRYAKPGTYEVALVVRDGLGRMDLDRVTIGVRRPLPGIDFPGADAGPDKIAREDEILTLDGTASWPIVANQSLLSFEWDFGDGTEPGHGPIAEHSFANAGDYVVRLQVTDPSVGIFHVDKALMTVLNVRPIAAAEASPPSAWEDDVVTFRSVGNPDTPSDLADLAYSWDFGDGTRGVGPVVGHAYSTAGNYVARLVLTDDNGESSRDEVHVSVANRPPVAEAGHELTILEGQAGLFNGSGSWDTFSDQPSLRYVWSFTPAVGPSPDPTLAGWSPSYTWWDEEGLSASFHQLGLRVTDPGGLQSEVSLVNVTVRNVPPRATITGIWWFADGILLEGRAFDPGADDLAFVWDQGGFARNEWYSPSRGDHPRRVTAYAFLPWSMAPPMSPITLTALDDEGGAGSDTIRFVAAKAAASPRPLCAVPPIIPPSCRLPPPDRELIDNLGPRVEVGPDVDATEDLTVPFQATLKDRDVPTLVDPDPPTSPSETEPYPRYEWDFGDGTTAIGKTAVHAFERAAQYTVTVTVTDRMGDQASSGLVVNVGNVPPIARFESAIQAEEDSTVVSWGGNSSETPSDGASLRYVWEYSDGTVQTGPWGIHDFTHDGPAWIRLRVFDDNGATSEAFQTVDILNANPVAVLPASLSALVGSSLVLDGSASWDTLSDRPGLSFVWRKDGVEIASGWNPVLLVPDDRALSLFLEVRDEDGAQAAETTVVTIKNAPPIVYGGPDLTVYGSPGPVAFVGYAFAWNADTTQLQPTWTFGDGTTASGFSVEHSFIASGSYSACLEVLVGSELGRACARVDVFVDSDGDNLLDEREAEMGTDPESFDSDGDGLTDFHESTALGTDPTLADSDLDGLSDWEEVHPANDGFVTNPVDPDTDRDGIPDGAEVATFVPVSSYSVSTHRSLTWHEWEWLGDRFDSDPWDTTIGGYWYQDSTASCPKHDPYISRILSQGLTSAGEFSMGMSVPIESLAGRHAISLSVHAFPPWLSTPYALDTMRVVLTGGTPDPEALTVSQGTEVAWSSADDPHWLTSKENLWSPIRLAGPLFDSGMGGPSFSYLFLEPGTYGFRVQSEYDLTRVQEGSITVTPLFGTFRVEVGEDARVFDDHTHEDWPAVYAGLDAEVRLSFSGADDYRTDVWLPADLKGGFLRVNVRSDPLVLRTFVDERGVSRPVASAWRLEVLPVLLVHRLGLDPTDADMDRDGIPDGVELARGSYPFDLDSDLDGLDDAQEVVWGTEPGKFDTDGDQNLFGDGAEVLLYDSDPRIRDMDGDRWPDGIDAFPRNPSEWLDTDCDREGNNGDTDDDGDRLDDELELAGWTVYAITSLQALEKVMEAIENRQEFAAHMTTYAVTSSPTSADTDLDGLSDFLEFLAHSDPRNEDTDGDLLREGYDDDPTITELQGPDLLITDLTPNNQCQLFVDWNIKRCWVTYSVYDLAGVDRVAVYKDGEYDRPVAVHPVGSQSAQFSDRLDVGFADAFNGARWEIVAYDRNGNSNYVTLEQPTVLDAIGNWITSITVEFLGPELGGLLSGAWYAFRDAVSDLATLFLEPQAIFDGGSAIAGAFQARGLDALVELGKALFEFIDATQSRANPYAAAECESNLLCNHNVFKFRWYAGYVAGTIGLMFVGVGLARAVTAGVKATQVFAKIATKLDDLADAAKVTQLVNRLRGIGPLNSRIFMAAVFTTAFAGLAYAFPEIFGEWFANYLGGAFVVLSVYGLTNGGVGSIGQKRFAQGLRLRAIDGALDDASKVRIGRYLDTLAAEPFAQTGPNRIIRVAVGRDSTGARTFVFAMTEGRQIHIFQRHVDGSLLKLSGDPTSFFPTGRTITGYPISKALPGTMTDLDVWRLIDEAVMNADPIWDGSAWIYRYMPSRFGIDELRVIVGADGRIMTAYPIRGSSVWAWDPTAGTWTNPR